MSAKSIELEILDGENALAMISQLIDLVRHHTGPRFNIKVRQRGLNHNGGRLHGRAYHIDREIGVSIYGLVSTTGDSWVIQGVIDDEMLAQHKWLSDALELSSLRPIFEGVYDIHSRTGRMRFKV